VAILEGVDAFDAASGRRRSPTSDAISDAAGRRDWTVEYLDVGARGALNRIGDDVDKPPAGLERRCGAGVHFAAEHVEHDVAVARGHREILVGVVDHPIGAEAPAEIRVAGAARRDHLGTQVMCDLNSEMPYAARARVDERTLAGRYAQQTSGM
jgi:hypothetical protein